MKMKLLPLLFILWSFAPTKGYSQILETVDMSVPNFANFNTYLTGINNSGYVTGYFNNGFNNIGFIITPTGKKLVVDAAQTGFPDSKAESINDNGVAVLTCNNGSSVGIFKCYIDTLGDSISHYVQVTGITQPSSIAFDINNNNDISGWFQASTRFLWVKHDSIVPTGNIPFESNRVEIGIDVYNTMVGGINDANKVAGFYIDGSLIKPFVYDNLTENFTYLNSAFKIRLWDINNNNWVAGEYLQNTNNIYMGFIANASTGSLTQFTSLNTIFDNNTIQSVANAINDDGVVVGSFLHPDPNVNIWIGFIYRPGTNELRIPGFDYHTGTWALNNNTGVGNTAWPSSYWGAFNYSQTDPYVNNGTPMFDNFLQSANPGMTVPNASSVDWLSFCKEVDLFNFGSTTNPYTQLYYHSVAKHVLFDKYKGEFGPYTGHCYGFTYSQLLHHFDDALFSQWFNIPLGTNISQVSNTDNDAIQAIARSYFRQNDIPTLAQYSTGGCFNLESMWSGLHEMKMEFLKPFSESNPRSLSFQLSSGGYHSVLPYKIRTPRTLPFDYPTIDFDTIYVHDSNIPQDSSKYFLVSSYGYNVPHTDAWYPNVTSLNFISLNKISIRELMNIPMTQYKSTSAGDEPYVTIVTDGPSYYDISTTGGTATSNGSGYSNGSPELLGLEYETQTPAPPVGHRMDTAYTAMLHTYNYTNNAMIWKQSNKMFSMGISRNAVSSESDNGEVELRRISYGNPDATTKYLACSYSEMDNTQQQGVSILATQVCADQGDSIVTSTPAPFVYQITKLTGSANCIYDLTIFAAYNGNTVHEFNSPIPMNGSTTHTIDPYFVGTNGQQIAVIVDNGNDGIPDDTLFVAGWPVGMEHIINKDGIKVYPNPVQDELNIEFAQAGTYNILLTDVVGRIVYTNTVTAASKTQLSLAQYPTGVYLLQVADSKGNSLLKDKIIKQ